MTFKSSSLSCGEPTLVFHLHVGQRSALYVLVKSAPVQTRCPRVLSSTSTQHSLVWDGTLCGGPSSANGGGVDRAREEGLVWERPRVTLLHKSEDTITAVCSASALEEVWGYKCDISILSHVPAKHQFRDQPQPILRESDPAVVQNMSMFSPFFM